MESDEAQRLVAEAMKKAAIAWVAVDDGPALGLWCLPLEGALYFVVQGPEGTGEQAAPDLVRADAAARVTVTLRGDHGGRIVTWPAVAEQLDPAGESWATIAPQLAAKRLNASGTAEALVARWVSACAIIRLAPATGEILAGAGLPDGSQAAQPRPTPATRRPAKPFRLHKVRGS